VNRLEAIRLSGGTIASFAASAPAPVVRPGLTLPQFAFAIGIGSNRGVGVLFDDPVLVIQDDDTTVVKRLIIPRAQLQGPQRWRDAVEPAVRPTTDAGGPPNNDIAYGPVRDRATALCRSARGVYVAMLAFPTLPYLVHYDVDNRQFRTYALPSSQRVMVVFERPGHVYYILAGETELRSADLATA
jgi:hypothetical protein